MALPAAAAAAAAAAGAAVGAVAGAAAAASGSGEPQASEDARSLARETCTPQRPRRYGNQSQGWRLPDSPGWGPDLKAPQTHL